MNIFGLTISEMGLSSFVIYLIVFFTLFFLSAFILTSNDLDFNGLLRVLYLKPDRQSDGKVEYWKRM